MCRASLILVARAEAEIVGPQGRWRATGDPRRRRGVRARHAGGVAGARWSGLPVARSELVKWGRHGDSSRVTLRVKTGALGTLRGQ